MARVTVIAFTAGTFKEGFARGRPSGTPARISTVNANFGTATNPDYRVPANTEAVVIITDTAIDFVIVRTDNPPSVEEAIPVPCVTGGLTQYVMFLEDGDNDLFVRTMV